MGFKLAELFVSLEAQTTSFDRAIAKARKDLIATGDAAAANSKLELPAPGSPGGEKNAGPGSGFDAAGQADQLAGVLLPLGNKIQQAIIGAMAPLNQFAARFSAQFQQVGGTIIAISRRIDAHLKFPTINKKIEELRGFAREKFEKMEGYPKKFGLAADRAFGTYLKLDRARRFFKGLGDVAGKPLKSLKGFKAGNINFDSSTRSVYNLGGAAQAAGNSFKSMGGQVALALGAFGLVYKAVGWIKEGITSAVNLGETVNKVGTVFGEQANIITAQAERMARSFGLPKGEMLDAAASFGLIGKAAGYNAGATAGLANQMTKLAADVSSFYNIPMDQALEKLRSGLVGEAEPMRALGVLLNEEAVHAEALAMGLTHSKKELTEQAKVQARASLIAKGLADATGDLEATQGSAANQFRKFKGTIANLGTSIGETLMPAVSKGIGLFVEFGDWAVRAFEGSRSSFEGFASGLASAFETIGVVFRNWQAVFEVARLGIVQGLINLGEQFEVLGPNIGIIAKYIGDNWYQLITDGINGTLTVLKNFATNIWAVGEAIGDFLSDPTQGFNVKWTGLLDGFEATAEQLPELIKPHLTDMTAEIAAASQQIVDAEAKRTSGAAAAAAKKRGIIDESADKANGKGKDKGQVSDLAGFAQHLQEAANGKKALAERGVKAQERTAKAVEKIATARERANPGVAIGPAWGAAGLS